MAHRWSCGELASSEAACAVRRGIAGFSAYPDLAGRLGVQLDEQGSRALPNSREIARLGALRLNAGGGLDPAELQPLVSGGGRRDILALTEAGTWLPRKSSLKLSNNRSL